MPHFNNSVRREDRKYQRCGFMAPAGCEVVNKFSLNAYLRKLEDLPFDRT